LLLLERPPPKPRASVVVDNVATDTKTAMAAAKIRHPVFEKEGAEAVEPFFGDFGVIVVCCR
jgi:hypothetical protein